jgi:hypothetical protein
MQLIISIRRTRETRALASLNAKSREVGISETENLDHSRIGKVTGCRLIRHVFRWIGNPSPTQEATRIGRRVQGADVAGVAVPICKAA